MTEINSPADLEQHVLSAPLALLDFWAPWCGPCRMMNPVLERLQGLYPDLVIAKVNVDENKPMAQAFGLRSIPTLMLFKDGELKTTLVGAQTLEKLQQAIASLS